jgi:hypothetical protein
MTLDPTAPPLFASSERAVWVILADRTTGEQFRAVRWPMRVKRFFVAAPGRSVTRELRRVEWRCPRCKLFVAEECGSGCKCASVLALRRSGDAGAGRILYWLGWLSPLAFWRWFT